MHLPFHNVTLYCPPGSLVAQGLVTESTLQRFITKVDISGECWRWTARLGWSGYGKFGIGKNFGVDFGGGTAHAMSYRLFVGPIPPKHQVDHQCHTSQCKLGNECPHRACVRPSHLQAITYSENAGRRDLKTTACRRGHPWTPESTITKPNGARTCRICARERLKATYVPHTPDLSRRAPNHNSVKTHCPLGHPYDAENTYNIPSGGRGCRVCNRIATKKYGDKKQRKALPERWTDDE